MADFDKILKKSIPIVNQGYDVAFRDLMAVVGDLGESIKNNSRPQFQLVLKPVLENHKGSIFRLYFDYNPENFDEDVIIIATFSITSKGYPITHGTYKKGMPEITAHGTFVDKNQIVGFFEEMLSDPDSLLIQSIGFAMRKYPATEEPEGEDADNIPF